MTKRSKILIGVVLVLAVVAGLFMTNTGLLKGEVFRLKNKVTKSVSSCNLESGTKLYDSSNHNESVYISFEDFVAVVSNTLKGENNNGVLPECMYSIYMHGGADKINESAFMKFYGIKSFSIYEGGEAMSIVPVQASKVSMSAYITPKEATLNSVINYGDIGSMNFNKDYDYYTIEVQ